MDWFKITLALAAMWLAYFHPEVIALYFWGGVAFYFLRSFGYKPAEDFGDIPDDVEVNYDDQKTVKHRHKRKYKDGDWN